VEMVAHCGYFTNPRISSDDTEIKNCDNTANEFYKPLVWCNVVKKENSPVLYWTSDHVLLNVTTLYT